VDKQGDFSDADSMREGNGRVVDHARSPYKNLHEIVGHKNPKKSMQSKALQQESRIKSCLMEGPSERTNISQIGQ
jgi:hypothetical protein